MITLNVLASGSSANAALLQLGDSRLLLDAGLPYRRLEESLTALGLRIGSLDGVLVTHEHTDHTRGLPLLAKRHPALPIYATAGTQRRWRDEHGWGLAARSLIAGRTEVISGVRVLPFGVSHDATDPVGFRLQWRDTAIGLATDLGRFDRSIVHALAGVRLLLVEANHDPRLLAYGNYPAHLKRRVASPQGHLSNAQAGALVRRVAGPALEHVVLIHASAENNRPELALATVGRDLPSRVALHLAARDTCSPGISLRRSRRPIAPVSGPMTQLALPLA